MSRRRQKEDRRIKRTKVQCRISNKIGGERQFTTGSKIASFFFIEFPEYCGVKYMYEIFKKKNGDIEEMVIPTERDKRGEQIRFRNIENERLFVMTRCTKLFSNNKIVSKIVSTWIVISTS